MFRTQVHQWERDQYMSHVLNEKSPNTTVLGLFLFVANIKACEMNWMGARKKSCGLFKMRASYE